MTYIIQQITRALGGVQGKLYTIKEGYNGHQNTYNLDDMTFAPNGTPYVKLIRVTKDGKQVNHIERHDPLCLVIAKPPVFFGTLRTMSCPCCGASSLGRQWWNRDYGYQICTDENCLKRNLVEHLKLGETSNLFGVRGIHWDVL